MACGYIGPVRRHTVLALGVAIGVTLVDGGCQRASVRRDRLDDAARGRSLVSLVADLPEEGRFELRSEKRQETTPMVPMTGVFWRTPSGNAYMRVKPYDRALVTRSADEVVARTDDARAEVDESTDPEAGEGLALLLLHDDFYRGDEHQLTVGDFVVATGALHVGSGSGVAEVADAECGRAAKAHDDAVRRWADTLEPGFRRNSDVDVWKLDLDAGVTETAKTAAAAKEACRERGGDGDPPADPPHVGGIEIERRGRTVSVVVVDDEWEADDRDVPFTIEVRDGDAGEPPDEPKPANAFAEDNQFLLRINHCEALPWEYVSFAAADSWVPPDSERYVGPTLLGDEYACEADVSPQDKAEAAEDVADLG